MLSGSEERRNGFFSKLGVNELKEPAKTDETDKKRGVGEDIIQKGEWRHL